MTWMVLDPALLLDQLGDPAGGPQPGGVAQCLRATLQPAFHPPQIRRAQTGLTACPSRLLQTGRPPSASCLAQRLTDWRWTPTSPGDFGLAQPPAKSWAACSRRSSPMLQSHVARRVGFPCTLVPGFQGTHFTTKAPKCHYVMRNSVVEPKVMLRAPH